MDYLKKFECPICLEYMIANIALCASGHSVCQRCKNRLSSVKCPVCKGDFSHARNYTLEDIAATTTFPCKHEGCDVKLEGKQMKKHQWKCPNRFEPCIMSFDGCTWRGNRTKIRNHIYQVHSDAIDKRKLCARNKAHVEFIFAYGHLFVICWRERVFIFTNITAVFIPLTDHNVPSAAKFKLTVTLSNPTQEGYELMFSIPCVERCSFNEIYGIGMEICNVTEENFRSYDREIKKIL